MSDQVLAPKFLICADCQEEFAFPVDAQEYFAKRGFTEDPKLCRACFNQRKREKKLNGHEHRDSASAAQQ